MRLNPGFAFALLTALSFGGLTTLASLYYQDGGNALTMLLVRFGCTSLGFALILRGQVRVPKPNRVFVRAIGVGVAWTLGVACYLGAVHYIDVGIAALVLYTFPVVVLSASLISQKIRASWALWLVFLLAFAGLTLMLLPNVRTFHPLGLGLGFGASILFASTFMLGAGVSREVAPQDMAFWCSVVGVVIIVPFVVGFDAVALPRSQSGWWFLGTATLLYIGGILAQFSALARARAVDVSMAMNFEPIVSVALGAWILSERLSPVQWLGAAAVLGSLVLSQRVMARQ